MVPAAAITLLGVVIKVSVCDESDVMIAELLSIDVSDGVETVVAIVLKFLSPLSCPEDAPSNMNANLYIEPFTDVMLWVLAGVGIEIVAAVTANTFAVMADVWSPV